MIAASIQYLGTDPIAAEYAREMFGAKWVEFDSIYIWKDKFIGYTRPANEVGKEIRFNNFYDYRVNFRGGE